MYAKVAPSSLTVRGVGAHSLIVMNVAAATTAYAPTTFELCLFPSFARVEPAPVPQGTFVSKLLPALTKRYSLSTQELALAEQLMYGRTLGTIARNLELCTSEVQRRCAALFEATNCDGRQQLFETALRLCATRELAQHFMYAA